MEDQMYSPGKHSMKNSYNRNVLLEWIKNPYDKNLFWLNKTIFSCHDKKWYNENIFYWIQIYFDWIKIYFDIMKKGYVMKIHFIKYKTILIGYF